MFQTIMLQAQQQSPYFSLIFMVGMVVVMYFFMIRPQAKRAKEQKKFAESINTGERIITSSGIHGTINKINDDGTIQVEISRGTFITVERSAVSMEMTNAFRKKTEGTAAIAAK
ncbi:MAG TPA: preprotein translocase subunit YajC [Flavipsychrobacter sp.]